MDVLKLIAQESAKTELSKSGVDDTAKVSINIRGGERERIQLFGGIVIACKGSGITEISTVRCVSYGIGMEKVSPIHSPSVKDVVIVRKGCVRRAKPYYLHDRAGKAAKVEEQTRQSGEPLPLYLDFKRLRGGVPHSF